MTPEGWRKAFEVFHVAVVHDAGTRAAYLDDACRGDAVIRRAVEQLVAAHEAAGDFLEQPAVIRVQHTELPPPAEDQTVADASPPDFTGTERFAIVRVLGRGGMGIVYEARDRRRNEIVALKTLHRVNPTDIYHLKHEFRGLADVAHHNLASLYELVVDGPHCFFTMEIVNGVSLIQHVREGTTAGDAPPVERITRAFGQLAEGLAALHGYGKLHRDIKPSNILVTPEGRVVILDFGLIADVLPERGGIKERVAGTPAYTAPEDIAGVRATEASDWYSVGITLYQALTGRVPFEGPFDEQLRQKITIDPPPPAAIAANVPDTLNAICRDLISREPARRLAGRDALRALALRPSDQAPAATAAAIRTPFVGRERPLAVLHDQFERVYRGRPTSVFIHGASGIGKSTLVRHFLDQLHTVDDVVILRGRCYEQETIPYKALDGVIDSLSGYLRSLPAREAERLLPRDVLALARLFPVMLQVGPVSAASPPSHDSVDPLALRRRAFGALHELLTAIADRYPVVFYIDDLHWADADSAVLLDELFRPSAAPPILALLCFRSEEVASHPFLQSLLNRSGSDGCEAIALEPMEADEADQLLGALIPRESRAEEIDTRRLAREAGGSPLLLEQLAHYVAVGETADRPATFGDMLRARLRSLPETARDFLDTLALCGRPMAPHLVYEACHLSGDERPLVGLLRSQHFIRNSGSAERVELYHDRVRQTLATEVPRDAARRIHRAMVETLVARQAADPDVLFEHYEGAGDQQQAATQAARAALRAGSALAFDRAAFLYRRAVELDPGAFDAPEWKQALGTALANAGRPADSADVYLDASAGRQTAERIELQRRAAEQLLIGGHIDRGLEVLREVLAGVGMRLASGPRAALASLIWRRAKLRWRGLDFVERAEGRVAADALLRVDTCWSVVTGLAMVDNIRAADFQTRHLILALETGEPSRVARALAAEAVFRASDKSGNLEGTGSFAERARLLSEKIAHPHSIALSVLTSGMGALLEGQWRQATGLCSRALQILRDECVGTTWEVNLAQNFLLGSLLFRGELREVAVQLPGLLASARERGNLYFETELRTRMNLVWLVADEPDEGQRQADEAMERWSHEGFHRQHYNHVLARIQTALYRGEAEAAWEQISRNWPSMERTFLFRVQFLRIEAVYLRARCALLMAGAHTDSARFLAVARGDARRIDREKTTWSAPVALLLDAAIACHEGRTALARQHLEHAVADFDCAEMQLYAAVARRRLGALSGGEQGRALMRQADDWMAGQDVRNPALLTRMFAPGFPGVDA